MKRQGWVVFAGDSPGNSVSVPMDLLPMGVVFFPSLPFMGVVLFPIFVVGDASGEGGTFLVSLSLFSPLLSLPLLSSPSPSFSVSLPLFPFPSSPIFHLFFLSFRLSLHLFPFSFLSLEGFFFLRELLLLFVSEM